MADQLVQTAPLTLTIDHKIMLAIRAGLSYHFNPRNLEYANRKAAELIAWKLGDEVSPCGRCSATTEFSFWPWEPEEGDQAEDLLALLIDGQLQDDNSSQGIETLAQSQISNPSTLKLGRTRYCACDVALFYTDLPPDFVIEPNDRWLGLPEPSDDYPTLPISLTEVKRNVSCQLGEEVRPGELLKQLEEAQDQLGEQAGFMFGNRMYQRLPYIIGIAMVAEVWCYAVFRQDARPENFDLTHQWVLVETEWSETFYWGTPRSDGGFAEVCQQVSELLGDMGFVVVWRTSYVECCGDNRKK